MKIIFLKMQRDNDTIIFQTSKPFVIKETPIADDHVVIAHILQNNSKEFTVHRRQSFPWEHIIPYVIETLIGNDSEIYITHYGFDPLFFEDLHTEVGVCSA